MRKWCSSLVGVAFAFLSACGGRAGGGREEAVDAASPPAVTEIAPGGPFAAPRIEAGSPEDAPPAIALSGCAPCEVAGLLGLCSSGPFGASPIPSPANGCAPYAVCACKLSGSSFTACACPTSCKTSVECLAPTVCHVNAATGLGVCELKNAGETCDPAKTGAECKSGHCVDGVCCNVACADQCAACDVAGHVGTCTPVTGAPHTSAATPRSGCTFGSDPTCRLGVCDGTDTLKCHWPTGTACGAQSCSAGVSQPAGSCDGAGGCTRTATSCGTYACGATTCKTTCASDADCAGGATCRSKACVSAGGPGDACSKTSDCTSALFCTNGVCCNVADCGAGKTCVNPVNRGTCVGGAGASCTIAADCASGFCVDKVCCNAACNGQCEACDVAGSVGLCVAVAGAPRGGRPACVGGGTGPCAPTCDGANRAACAFPGGGTACGFGSCALGVETHVSACDGSGHCLDAPRPCGAYACNGAACASDCSADGDVDCAAGFYCDAATHLCAKVSAKGKPCAAPTSCGASMFCTDGFCCDAADCGSGASCGVPGHEGTCSKIQGAACAADADCASGHCVDGVCCDSACSGVCEACDLPDSTTGRPGKCIPVKGAPHGKRAACPSGSDPCSATSCDGAATATCAAKAGPETSCHTGACVSGASGTGGGGDVATTDGACDGKGTCKFESIPCAAYRCTADHARCLARCDTRDDCQAGFACAHGTCQLAACSDDGASSIAADGTAQSCAPFRCGSLGTCLTICTSSVDCASGDSCDTSRSLCVAAVDGATTTTSGGCAVGRVGEGERDASSGVSGMGALALGALGVLGAARRRRRAR